MDGKKLYQTFCEFNHKYFWDKLGRVKVVWSNKMTLCAGKTYLRVRGKKSTCTIRLSWPLLSQRPQQDTINTLLHEMIHAYFNVTRGINYRVAHGPEFRKHMARLNSTVPGANVTIYHGFKKEVNNCRVHVYRCDGPCRFLRPNFGILRRAVKRPPGPSERWWGHHKRVCGGIFKKIEGSDISKLDSQKNTSNNLVNSALKNIKNNPSITYKPIHKPLKRIIPKTKTLIMPKKNSHPVERKYQTFKLKSNIQSEKKVTKNEIPVIQIDDSEEDSIYEFTDDPLDRIKEKYSSQKKSILIDEKNVPLITNGSTVVAEDINLHVTDDSLDRIREKYSSQKKSIPIDEKNVPLITNGSTVVAEDINLHLTDDPLDRIREKYSSQKRSILIDVKDVPIIANGSTVVVGDINFQYKSKNPKMINIEKYLEKMSKNIEKSKSETSLDSFPNLHKIKNNLVNGNVNYNYETKSNLNISKYINKYKKSIALIETTNTNPNLILNNELNVDDSRWIDDDTKFQKSYSPENSLLVNNHFKAQKDPMNESVKNDSSHDNWIDFGQILICPNCDKEVLEVEFHDHLSYCVDSEDEGESENECSESDEDELCPKLPPEVICCPACMEHVKEEDIQQHMEVCLEGMVDEL